MNIVQAKNKEHLEQLIKEHILNNQLYISWIAWN